MEANAAGLAVLVAEGFVPQHRALHYHLALQMTLIQSWETTGPAAFLTLFVPSSHCLITGEEIIKKIPSQDAKYQGKVAGSGE